MFSKKEVACLLLAHCLAIVMANETPEDNGVLIGDKFIQLGKWRIGDADGAHLSIAYKDGASHFTAVVFESDGHARNGKRNPVDQYSTWDRALEPNGVEFGHDTVQIGEWRLGTPDDVHFSIAHKDGYTSIIYRKDGTTHYGPTNWGKGTWQANTFSQSLDSNIKLAEKTIQIGTWRVGDFDGVHFSISHEDGYTSIIYRNDGTAHNGPTNWGQGTWQANTYEGRPVLGDLPFGDLGDLGDLPLESVPTTSTQDPQTSPDQLTDTTTTTSTSNQPTPAEESVPTTTTSAQDPHTTTSNRLIDTTSTSNRQTTTQGVALGCGEDESWMEEFEGDYSSEKADGILIYQMLKADTDTLDWDSWADWAALRAEVQYSIRTSPAEGYKAATLTYGTHSVYGNRQAYLLDPKYLPIDSWEEMGTYYFCVEQAACPGAEPMAHCARAMGTVTVRGWDCPPNTVIKTLEFFAAVKEGDPCGAQLPSGRSEVMFPSQEAAA